MSQSEKFCLKWNDFQTNIVSSILDLRNATEFSDVTLACEDGQQIKAHIIVLTACSPVFRSIMKRNNHSHHWIYMRGIKSKDLVSLVDFIYLGEANVFQEDLDAFLALPEEMQLKGLSGSQNEDIGENKKHTRNQRKSKN